MSYIGKECGEFHLEFKQCLNNSDLRPSKCEAQESRLRACETTFKLNFCIDETIGLMNCARNPDKTVCAKQFLMMRECNRPDGAHLRLSNDNQIEIVEPNSRYYTGSISEPISAPPRGQDLLDQSIDSIKRRVKLKNFNENASSFQWGSA